MPPQYSYAANGSVRCYNCTLRFTPTYVAAATASFRCPYCQFSYGLSQPYPGLGYFPTIPHTPPPPTTPSQSPTSWLDEMFEEEDHDDYDDFNTLVNRVFSETNQYESRCYNCTLRFTPTYVSAATASFRCPYCQFSYDLSQPYPGGYFPTIPLTPPPPTTPSQSPTSWLDEMFEEEGHDDYDDFNTLVNRFFSETNQYESRPTAASESFIYYLKAHEQTVSGTILPELINVGPCAICSDEYKLSEVVNKLPCRHWFHTDCIIPWLIRKNNCPLCRHEFSDTEHSLPL